MNLNEIITKLNKTAWTMRFAGAVDELEDIESVIQDITPRSMDQKPRHGQWCLLLKKDMPCLVAQYNMYLDSFVTELSFYKSDSFKWLPVPEWKEDE